MKYHAIAVFSVLLFSPFRTAAAQSELPNYSGESVVAQGTPDVYDPVRETIRQAEARSPRRYYVVGLDSVEKWSTGAQSPVLKLYDNWVADAARNPRKFDGANSVVILLALGQRHIGVRTGQVLQQRYGLTDARMEKDLVPKYFIPTAKDGDIVGGLNKLISGIERTISDQEAAEAAHQRMIYRYLPFGIFGGVGAVGLSVAGFFLWRRRSEATRAGESFAAFNLKLIELMEQCDAIKQQHQLLPYSDKDFTEPMAGATAALYDSVEKRLAELRQTWLGLMDVRNQVERLIQTSGPAGGEKIREALRLLKEKGSLPNVDALYAKCRQDLETLGQAHEQATTALNAARQSQSELPALIAALQAAALAERPYVEQREAIEKQLSAIAAQLTADPIGAREAIGATQTRLTEVHARAAELLELDKLWRAAGERRQQIVEQVAGERAGGLKLDESQANPDEPLQAAEAALKDARAALLADQPTQVRTSLDAATKAADAAVAIVAQVRSAREKCEQALAAGDTGSPTELQRKAEQSLRELTRDYAPESWGTVAENITQAGERFQFAAAARAEARALATDARQAYVSAAAKIDAANAADASGVALLNAVVQRAQELNALRESCAQQRGALLEESRQLRALLERERETIDEPARALFAEAGELEEKSVGEIDSARPNWPGVKQLLDRLADALHSAQAAAEADVRNRNAFAATLTEAQRQAARVEQVLRSSSADRKRANDTYRRAATTLAQLQGTRGDWKRLLGAAEQAKLDLANAEKWATEDIQLAAQAAQAISAAERAVGAARSFVLHGISAESAMAATALAEASRLLAAQNYEQAITQAGAAEQSARQAVQEAEQAARMRQMQHDAERRRRQTNSNPLGPLSLPSFPSFPIGGGGGGGISLPSSPAPSQASSNTWSGAQAAHGNWSSGASSNTW